MNNGRDSDSYTKAGSLTCFSALLFKAIYEKAVNMKRRYEHTREEQREKMAIDARIIVDLYDSDYSTEEIAKSVGRQKNFVYKAWHDAGLPKRLTHLQKQVLSLRNEGRSCVEIADFLGKETRNISSIARAVGKPFTEDEKRLSRSKGKKKAIEKQYGTVEERKQKQIDFFAKYHPNFEYVDGWLASDGMVRIKCRLCGTTFERSAISVRRKGRHIKCRVCEEAKRQERERKKLIEEDRKRSEIQAQKIAVFWNQDFQQIEMKTCSRCGGIFYGRKSRFCSRECYNRSQYSGNKDKRIKKIRKRVVDKDIELNALFRRDNGVCWLCGEKCDYSDYQINENGHFIVGKNYPSIDHVVPLAKGGIHSWYNVKLAHHYCNTLKRDKVVS